MRRNLLSKRFLAFITTACLLSLLIPATLLAGEITVPATETVYSSAYTFQASLASWQNGDDFDYRLEGDDTWYAMQQIQSSSNFFAAVTLEAGVSTFDLLHTRPAGLDTDTIGEASIEVTFMDLELVSSNISDTDAYELEIDAPGFDDGNSSITYSMDDGDTFTAMTAGDTDNHFTADLTLVDGGNEVIIRETSVFEQEPTRERTFNISHVTLSFISIDTASEPDYLLILNSNAYNLDSYDVQYRAYKSGSFAVPSEWTNVEPSLLPNLHTISVDLSDETGGGAGNVTIEARVVIDLEPIVTIVKKEERQTIDYNPYMISLLSDDSATSPDGETVAYNLEVSVAGIITTPFPNSAVEYTTTASGVDLDADAATWSETSFGDDMFTSTFDVSEDLDLHVRVISILSETISEKTFALDFIDGSVGDIIPAPMPHELVSEDCQFVDVDFVELYNINSVYYDAILTLCDTEGWVTGDDTEVTIDGNTGRQVRLDDSIARTEFAKLVVLGPGEVDPAGINNELATGFSDTPAGQWFSGPIRLARENSWMKGYQDAEGNITGFGPLNELTYAEAAVTMLRVAGVNTDNSCTGEDAQRLGVDGEGREWMKDAICYADKNNLLHLEGRDFFDPAAVSIPRKEVFYMMNRMLEDSLIGS